MHMKQRLNFPQEWDRAEQVIDNYCQNFETLFPEEQLVYNLHLLKYIVGCVREIGSA